MITRALLALFTPAILSTTFPVDLVDLPKILLKLDYIYFYLLSISSSPWPPPQNLKSKIAAILGENIYVYTLLEKGFSFSF